MVTDAVLDWWFDLVEWLLNLIPASTLPATVVDFSWISDMNYFIPINEMFQVFLGFWLLGGPLAGTSLIIWFLVGVLRGGSSRA